MPFYDPNELSNYGQDITDLQDAQVNRLVDRAITQPAPVQGTPSPVPGGGVPPGLAAALIQQLSQQQQAPQSLGEVLRNAVRTAGETGQAYFQSKAGIDPNLNNPTTLRNALLQKAAIQQLIQDRILATQRDQEIAAQKLAELQHGYKVGEEGVKQTNRMALNATPKAIDSSISGFNRARTKQIDTLLDPTVTLRRAQADEARSIADFNRNPLGTSDGGAVNSDTIPPDANPVGSINPNTGAVTAAPGQTISPGEVRNLQDALSTRRPNFPRQPVIESRSRTGPVVKYEKGPAELAYETGQQTTAKEQAKALPDATAGKLAEFQGVEDTAKDILTLVKAHPEFLGVERSYTKGIREKIGHGAISPDEDVFHGKVNQEYAQLTRALQGARASDQDIQNFGKNIFPGPEIRDPEVFQARVLSAIEYVRNYKIRYQGNATTPRGKLEQGSTAAPVGGAPRSEQPRQQQAPQPALKNSAGEGVNISPLGQSVIDKWRAEHPQGQ